MPGEKTRELEAKLGHTFKDRTLLLQALTHKSYANENREEGSQHNERLEFLGDTVLDFIVSDLLMKLCPESPEGELSKLRSVIVSEANLSEAARSLGLGAYLLLGRGEEQTGGRDKSSLLANALEAVIAALYLDGGIDAAFGFVRRQFELDIREMATSGRTFDSKTELQEYCQSTFGELPAYTVTSESGPDHLKLFEVEIVAGGRPLGRGQGRSKKEAEQNAARIALEALK
jgi:ribonuclease-3